MHIHLVHEYTHPPARVWLALTDPELMPLWTRTGQGARPEGFSTEIGTQFRFVARPVPGWNGIVRCEVLEAEPSTRLRYSWQDDGGGPVTEVTYLLEPVGGGTRLTYDHTGFSGVGGFVMSRLLGRVRRTMLAAGMTTLLDDLDADGRLREGSTLRPKSMYDY